MLILINKREKHSDPLPLFNLANKQKSKTMILAGVWETENVKNTRELLMS
jgi:hypothetical protein